MRENYFLIVKSLIFGDFLKDLMEQEPDPTKSGIPGAANRGAAQQH